ncbi:MAG: hypothetical protein PHR09_04060 [Bacilli bacterium]|nr:hypothetical protein [Bacilli bacterium]
MNKFKINRQVIKKTFLIMIFFSLFLLLLFSSFSISTLIKTKNYVALNSTIIDVGYKLDTSSSSEGSQSINYIIVEYEYKNINYSSQQRVFFRFNKNIGDNIKIHVNPLKPNELRDNYNLILSTFISIIFFITHIFMIKAYIIKSKKNTNK